MLGFTRGFACKNGLVSKRLYLQNHCLTPPTADQRAPLSIRAVGLLFRWLGSSHASSAWDVLGQNSSFNLQNDLGLSILYQNNMVTTRTLPTLFWCWRKLADISTTYPHRTPLAGSVCPWIYPYHRIHVKIPRNLVGNLLPIRTPSVSNVDMATWQLQSTHMAPSKEPSYP